MEVLKFFVAVLLLVAVFAAVDYALQGGEIPFIGGCPWFTASVKDVYFENDTAYVVLEVCTRGEIWIDGIARADVMYIPRSDYRLMRAHALDLWNEMVPIKKEVSGRERIVVQYDKNLPVGGIGAFYVWKDKLIVKDKQVPLKRVVSNIEYLEKPILKRVRVGEVKFIMFDHEGNPIETDLRLNHEIKIQAGGETLYAESLRQLVFYVPRKMWLVGATMNELEEFLWSLRDFIIQGIQNGTLQYGARLAMYVEKTFGSPNYVLPFQFYVEIEYESWVANATLRNGMKAVIIERAKLVAFHNYEVPEHALPEPNMPPSKVEKDMEEGSTLLDIPGYKMTGPVEFVLFYRDTPYSRVEVKLLKFGWKKHPIEELAGA